MAGHQPVTWHQLGMLRAMQNVRLTYQPGVDRGVPITLPDPMPPSLWFNPGAFALMGASLPSSAGDPVDADPVAWSPCRYCPRRSEVVCRNLRSCLHEAYLDGPAFDRSLTPYKHIAGEDVAPWVRWLFDGHSREQLDKLTITPAAVKHLGKWFRLKDPREREDDQK